MYFVCAPHQKVPVYSVYRRVMVLIRLGWPSLDSHVNRVGWFVLVQQVVL